MKFNHFIMEDALESIIDYRGKTPHKSMTGIKTLSAKSVKDGYIDYSQCYCISKDEYNKFMVRGIPKKGDVLLTTEAPLGNTARLDRENVALAQRLLTLRGKNGILDTGFLYYYLRSPVGQAKLRSRETGTTVTGIKQSAFRKIEIDVPEFKVQKKVAHVLSTIDEKITLNKAINKNLEEQARAIFQKCFISNPDNSTWASGTFNDIVESILGGDWGKASPTGNYTNEVYCIRGADIPDVKAGNKGKMPTRFILQKNYSSKHLTDGDVVIEISGGSPTQSTGRIAAISQPLLDRYDKGMVCTNFCKALKPKHGYTMFLYYYWQYLYDKNIFFSYENGTTGIKNLDISGFINSEPIALPPKGLIERFNNLCRSISNEIFTNGLESEQLADVRDALIPRLMSGEIDVSSIDI